jgi:transposase
MAKRLTKKEIDLILNRYAKTMSISAAAKLVGRSCSSVKKAIEDNDERLQKFIGQQKKSIVSAEKVIQEYWNTLDKLSRTSLKKLEMMINDTVANEVSVRDLVQVQKIRGDLFYQMKAIQIREREVIVKEKMLALLESKDIINDPVEIINIINENDRSFYKKKGKIK